MAAKTLDIVIPVKNRTTILRCVSTLLAQLKQVENLRLGQILVCDGGSQQTNCQAQLHQVAQLAPVRVLTFPQSGFNKGWLLNWGLQATTASLILISDVDILWNAATLANLGAAAAGHPACLCYIGSVQESDPALATYQRPRYAYRLSQTPTSQHVEIYPASPSKTDRPGYGLLCGQRHLFYQIRGYRHSFQGWGWEDQDLLMRAQLLGFAIAPLGSVIHLSHGDDQRNLAKQRLTPAISRDRNILICLEGLAQGKLLGDLPPTNSDSLEPPDLTTQRSIRVHYPTALAYAAYPNHTLSKSSGSPD